MVMDRLKLNEDRYVLSP